MRKMQRYVAQRMVALLKHHKILRSRAFHMGLLFVLSVLSVVFLGEMLTPARILVRMLEAAGEAAAEGVLSGKDA